MSLRARVFELPPRERPERPTGVGAWLACLDGWRLLTIYAALAVALFSAAWIHPFSTVIGVGPDPPVFIWYLRWLPFALSHGMNPLFANYLDYPDGINLMWQTSVPLLGLLMWPVTATLGPIFSYNLVMTASVALSAFCGFLACRRHVSRAWPAAAGGLLFGFSPYMLAQSLGHPHVAASFICPLLLIAFEEAVVRQQRSWWRLGLAIGGLAAAQLLISEEMLLTQALLAALALAVLWGLRPDLTRGRVAYLARAGGLAAGVVAMIAAIPIGFQFFGPQAVHGTLPTSNVFVSDLAGFFLPTSQQALAPSAITALSDRFGGTQYEGVAYIGLPLVAVLIGGAVRWWRFPVVQVASVLTLVAAALSLGVTLHIGGIATGVPTAVAAAGFVLFVRTKVGRLLPVLFAMAWLGLAVVPLLNNVVPSRLMAYVFLFASLLVAVFADSWVSEAGALRSDGRRRIWKGNAPPLWSGRGRTVFGASGIAIALTGLAVLALAPRVPFATSPVQVPDFFTSGSALGDGDVTLVVPIAHDFESRAMLWQLSSGMRFRMPEGYANRPGPSLDPPETALGNALIAMQYGSTGPVVSTAFRSAALRELRQREVRAVVVGPMDGQARIVEFLSEVIGTPPTQQGGVVFWRLPR